MISDTERREVARRLRAAKRPSLMVLMDVLCVGGEGVFARLADLIEPPAKLYDSPNSSNSEADEGHEVAIDRDALLKLADEMYRDGKMQRERQKSGVHWFVDGLDVMEYARRIREALGVVE